jgi:hypothetical protein
MRSKLLKHFSVSFVFAVLGSLGFSSLAYAVSVVPYNVPNAVVDNGDGFASVYYLDATYVGQGAPGYATHAFNGGATFEFSISGADTSLGFLWVYAQDATDSSTYYPVVLSSCSAGAIATVGRCDSGNFTDFVVGINFQAVCAGTNGSSIRGCNGATVGTGVTPIKNFRLRFLSSSSGAPGSTSAAGGTLLQIFPQVVAPTVTGPASPGFFPGDESLLIDTSQIVATADASTGSSPVFPFAWIAAEEGTVTPGNEMAATIRQSMPYASAQVEIGGFKNSTQTTQYFYEMALGVQDSAGAVAFSSGGKYTNVFATDIKGFLRESKCFVATASFRDGRAPGVMLLRNFRDEVLSAFPLGRDFITWYYANGPRAADWLIEHPIFRSVSLMFLVPVQAAAWVALHPAFLILPFIAFLILLGLFAETGGLLSLLLIGSLLIVGRVNASEQPYIDSLISELPAVAKPTSGVPDPYIQSLKMTTGKEVDSAGYTDSIKKSLAPGTGSENYSEQIQRKIPKASGSAIEDYRNGKKLKPNKGSLDTRSAFGFNLNAGATRTYASGANTDVDYGTVYGNGWVPDFTFHYEWRPFTGDFIKKFGIYTSLGASFTKAKGILDYQGTFPTNQSNTDFQFITLPVNAGLIYRFSVFDFMWPYFGGGPSAIGLIETRNDSKKGERGYAFGYWGLAGIAFGLDWISPKSSWDQYESSGVKHSYFTIDYSYLESVGGGLIEFTVDGVQLGFTFEI